MIRKARGQHAAGGTSPGTGPGAAGGTGSSRGSAHGPGPVEPDRPGTGHQVPENYGDLVFSLCDRQDRLYGRLDKKIGRLDERVSELERRGRS